MWWQIAARFDFEFRSSSEAFSTTRGRREYDQSGNFEQRCNAAGRAVSQRPTGREARCQSATDQVQLNWQAAGDVDHDGDSH
jgi:hypothetical protein